MLIILAVSYYFIFLGLAVNQFLHQFMNGNYKCRQLDI
jgi:hypothetical protein